MLLELARLPVEMFDAANKMACGIAEKLRNQKSAGGRAGIVQGLLQEFSLSSQKGVALMCLAEALLRIPDKGTRDALIRDKISTGNWQQHLGQSGTDAVERSMPLHHPCYDFNDELIETGIRMFSAIARSYCGCINE